jgi:hypothetical protein
MEYAGYATRRAACCCATCQLYVVCPVCRVACCPPRVVFQASLLTCLKLSSRALRSTRTTYNTVCNTTHNRNSARRVSGGASGVQHCVESPCWPHDIRPNNVRRAARSDAIQSAQSTRRSGLGWLAACRAEQCRAYTEERWCTQTPYGELCCNCVRGAAGGCRPSRTSRRSRSGTPCGMRHATYRMQRTAYHLHMQHLLITSGRRSQIATKKSCGVTGCSSHAKNSCRNDVGPRCVCCDSGHGRRESSGTDTHR